MTKYRNLMLMLVSLVLLCYAGLLSIYPSILTSLFNKEIFAEKVYKATTLDTTLDSINFKMKPNLTLIITIRKWSSKHKYKEIIQDCFSADIIELQTGAFSPITKNFPIKKLYLKHVKFSNQVLPNGVNKLAYLPRNFNPSVFGKDQITITPGPVLVNDFKIKHIAPGFYKEDNRKESSYSKDNVRAFLNKLKIKGVVVK